VLALSGPRLKGSGLAELETETETQAVVLVLDDSPGLSLRREGAGGEFWRRALASLGEALKNPAQRRVAVETAGGRGLPFEPAGELPKRLGELAAAPQFASGDRPAALTRAVALLKDAPQDRRAVVLFSDLQLSEQEGAGEALTARWNAALSDFAARGAPALVLADAGSPVARQWRVDMPTGQTPAAPQRVPVAGSPFQLVVAVRCLAGAGARRLAISGAPLRREGQSAPVCGPSRELLQRTLTLAAGEVSEVAVPILAAAPGALRVTARLEGADELPYDDAAEVAVLVRPKRQAVLWDLRRAGAPGTGALDIALRSTLSALDPLQGAEASRARVSRPAAADAGQLTPTMLLVALHDPFGPALNQEQRERLRGAVEAGTTLLWAPDLTGTPKDWPAPLPGRAVAADALLPGSLEGAEEAGAGAAWRIGDAGAGHPLLRPFAGGRNGDLEGIPFKRRARLNVKTEGSRAPGEEPALILARFDDGPPALVRQPLGAGAVYQLAFGIEPQGGLAESAAWPILMAEFLELAAGDGLGQEPAFELGAGAPAPAWQVTPRTALTTWRLDGPWNPEAAFGAEFPGGAQRWELELPARAEQLALPALPVPGLYHLRASEGGAERWLGVRISAQESALEALPQAVRAALERAARASGGAVAHGLPELPQALRALRPARPLAPILWVVFGVCMAVELTLQVLRARLA
jgi:hypothetical protein